MAQWLAKSRCSVNCDGGDLRNSMAISIFKFQECCPRAESPNEEVASREAGASSALHREERAASNTTSSLPQVLRCKGPETCPYQCSHPGCDSHLSWSSDPTAANPLPLSRVAPPAGPLHNPNPSGLFPGLSLMSS